MCDEVMTRLCCNLPAPVSCTEGCRHAIASFDCDLLQLGFVDSE